MRTLVSTFILAGALSAAGASPLVAQTPRAATAAHTRIELLPGLRSFEAGGAGWIGVRLTLEPGWHIYWRNPGDSGSPPLLLWTPPRGVIVGDVAWPVPERIPFGPLVNYGLQGDVVLPVSVRVDRAASGPLTLDASWVVCRDVCVQGRARVSTTWPLSGESAAALPGAVALIEAARARTPQPLPKTWQVHGTASLRGFLLSVTAPRRIASASFFAVDEGVIDESADQVVTPSSAGASLRLARSPHATSAPTTLRGVLVVDADAYDVVVPLGATRPPRKGRP